MDRAKTQKKNTWEEKRKTMKENGKWKLKMNTEEQTALSKPTNIRYPPLLLFVFFPDFLAYLHLLVFIFLQSNFSSF